MILTLCHKAGANQLRSFSLYAPLIDEVDAWQNRRNKNHAKADWQFTTADARVKLKRLYPTL